jgi:phytoene dehydrogenase-like protein
MNQNRKIVIVGAGMAGLSAAAYLARENFNVLLLDKNDRWGGLVNTFEQGGFTFDAGPRAFVNSGIVKPMLRDLGIEGDFLPNRISIGIEDEIFTVESMDSLSEYQRILVKLFPESEQEIAAIVKEIEKLSGYTRVLSDFDNPSFVNIMDDKGFIFKELLPWTVKFLLTIRKMKKYQLPMEDYLDKFTENQSLQDILTQLFFRQTPTHFALGYFYVYLDYFYPKTGTAALPRLLAEKITSSGGKIKLNTEIVEVRPAEHTVVDANGEVYPYDRLVWAGDLKTLYHRTLAGGLDPDDQQAIETQKARVLAAKGAESVFILFLGVDRPPAFFKERGGEHHFYTPLRNGLGMVNRNQREDLLAYFDLKSKEEVFSWLKKYIDLNTYEISVPVLRDENLAPAGQTGLMISCLFDYYLFEKVKMAGWYEEFKTTLESRIIDNLSKTIFEDFRQDILFKFSSTPLTIKNISGSSGGAITGWSFETDIPVVNQLLEIPKSVLTPIPDVYQAGQWTYVPAGVPVAMLTGWHASQLIIKTLE